MAVCGSSIGLRDIILSATVAEPERWQIAPLLARMLDFLTGDQREFQFRKRRHVLLPQEVELRLHLLLLE